MSCHIEAIAVSALAGRTTCS